MTGSKRRRGAIALACVLAGLSLGVAFATGTVTDWRSGAFGTGSKAPNRLVPGSEPDNAELASNETPASLKLGHGQWRPVYNDEALPCTGPRDPVNFETYSPGPSVAGVPLTTTLRRCDGGAISARANYVSYIYGDCEIPKGATGCQPPLEVQSWPACQRYLAKYSFRGDPPPQTKLGKRGHAEVVELSVAGDARIEVYSKSTTVVIFAINRDLATTAVDLLRPRSAGKPPAEKGALQGSPAEELGAPTNGSMRGALPCHS